MYVQLISNQSGSACPAGNCAVHRVPVLPVLHAALAHGTGCRGCAAERTLGRREKVGQGRPTRTGGLCHVSRNKKKEESSLSSSGEHGRATQSCTGAFLRLPGKAATQQNAVLHGRLFALARLRQQRSLAWAPCFACQGRQQHTWQARRSSSTTVIQHDGHPARRYGTAQILAVSGVPRAVASSTGNQRRRPCLVITETRTFAWSDAFLHTLPWRADDAARPELMALILMRHVGSGGPCAALSLSHLCQMTKAKKK